MIRIEDILSKKINCELISYFLDLIENNPVEDRKDELKIGLNPDSKKQKECLSELYFPAKVDGEKQAQEDLLNCEKAEIISIQYRDKKSYSSLHKRKAVVVFNLNKEDECRAILGKELVNYKEQWIKAIKLSQIDKNTQNILCDILPIYIKGKEAKDVIERVQGYLQLHRKNDFIREASAYMFWGRSKTLDNRTDLWELFSIKQHPMQFLTFCATSKKNVLFIENKQTFESLQRIQEIKSEYILIYLSGFMGTAFRTRKKEYRSVYVKYDEDFNLSIDMNEIFEDTTYRLYFWGDLDYEGINIFVALKKVFAGVALWRYGYDLMLKKLYDNQGHDAESYKKGKQKRPQNIAGEAYITDVLIPSMDEKGFYDQEGILFT